eukprot:1708468-Alexandrium_andersonii.AAC.1
MPGVYLINLNSLREAAWRVPTDRHAARDWADHLQPQAEGDDLSEAIASWPDGNDMAAPFGDQRRRAEVSVRREEGRRAAGGQAQHAE